MFVFTRKGLEELQRHIDNLEAYAEGVNKAVEDNSTRLNNMVTCESCGCLLLKENAVEGKSEVLDLLEYNYIGCFDYRLEKVKKIHTPYYCKFCAPEEE